jgi:hypothetical protein
MRAKRSESDASIGAPNPYALARYLTQQPWDADDRALAGVFMVTDWRLLFVPNERSPTILDALLESKVQAQRFKSVDHALAELPTVLTPAALRTFEQVMHSSRGQELGARLASVLLPVDVTNEQLAGQTTWNYRPAEGTLCSGPAFDDPMQGNWLNCYYIAALIAVAWAQPDEWGNRLQQMSDLDGTLKWTFMQSGPDTTLRSVADLPMDGAVAGGATSRSAGDFWPGILEKVFAMFCNDVKVDNAGDNLPSKRQYRVMNRHQDLGFPEEALGLLLGGVPDKAFSSVGRRAFLAELRSRLGTPPARRPVAASTHQSLGDSARDIGLVARHAYAVLDVLTEPDLVILRDPYGTCPGGSSPVDPPTNWRAVNEAKAGATLDAKHGYLAVSADEFVKHFKSISYVLQPGLKKNK